MLDKSQYLSSNPIVELDWLNNPGFYRGIVESLPVAVYTCDSNGYITFFNEAAAQLWGRAPEIGKDRWSGCWKIYKPDNITPLPLDESPMAIALQQKISITDVEIILERPDGTRRNILPHPQPIFDSEGNQVGAINLLVDITEKKRAEADAGQLAAIVHSSNDAIISKTLKGIITSWNPAAEKLFGYKSEEVIGQPITMLIPKDRLQEEPLIIERLQRGERVEHFETKRLTKSGKLIDISLMISPIRNSQGIIIGASKIARNISDKKILDDALRESEERLRMASEAGGIGTWEFDPRTAEMIWSHECKKIYGLAADEVVDNTTIGSYNHPNDQEYIANELKEAMNPDGKNDFNIEYRIIRKSDNQIRWIKAQGKMYFNNLGPERFVGTMIDITDEKQTLQQIKEREETLRLAIQSTHLGTWEYNTGTGKLILSDECLKIYEVPAGVEIDEAFINTYVYEEDLKLVREEVLKSLAPETDGSFEILYRIRRYSDKQTRWIKTFGKVYFNGKFPERLIGTVLDVTKEKAEEQELKDSIELFQTMADNVPAMIWMSGNDKFNDYFNKSWLAFRGKTREEESKEGWLEGVHPDDRQKCIDTYKNALNSQKGFYSEYRLLRHDGNYRWISDNCVPRISPQGEFSGFISAAIDIDDQKRFREKILESELLFKTISNVSPVGLWMTDTEGQNTFVNDTWIEWTGIPWHEQLGVGWLSRVVEEDRLEAPGKFRECLIKRQKFSTEFRIVRKDGELRWCFTEGSPYYDFNGIFAGYAGSVTDITEMKRLEDRKDDFIKMASHELKTPITSIKGYVQLLQALYEEADDEKLQLSRQTVKSSLGTIGKQVSKLTRLVSELLDLTRIESGKLELYQSEFDPGMLVEETAQDIRQTSTRHIIEVHNDFKGKLHADKDRIGQVLTNLLTNAIKYSPNTDRVVVHVKKEDDEVVISITDQGIGIDKKDHGRIFERFYRVEGKSEQTYPGFGIGLFIANEIIERHNGRISVTSEKGKGSSFTFNLPLLKQDSK